MNLRLLFFLSLMNLSLNLFPQLLNLPESVEYDPYNNRYIVSNWGNGNIVQIDSTGNQSVWLYSVQCFAGLHRIDNILYVACREYGVKGYDLLTGENVLEVDIPGTTNINDITSDNSGNLYVSYPTGNSIYRININSQTASEYVSSGLDTPNGIYFDEPNNRLLLVSYRYNSPIQEISLIDSTVSVITYPNLHNLDGITKDNEGNFYVSSWYTNRVYRFDSTFSNAAEIFSNHPDDPADIYFDKQNNVLAVPLFFTHQIEFIEAGTGINASYVIPASEILLMQNYPNPFNPTTEICFQLSEVSQISLSIYNIKGQLIRTLINEIKSAGEHFVIWNGLDQNNRSVPAGIYMYKLGTRDDSKIRKMILIK